VSGNREAWLVALANRLHPLFRGNGAIYPERIRFMGGAPICPIHHAIMEVAA
jgi:hypothetical protein